MDKFKLAVVTLGDTRINFYKQREEIAQREITKIKSVLEDKYDIFMPPIVFDVEQGLKIADQIKEKNIQAVIIHVPIWATPSLAMRIAFATNYPVMLLGNLQRNTSSLVTLLAVAGMLDQVGKKCVRLSGEYTDKTVQEDIHEFAKSIYVDDGLHRSCYGMIGGRSIGIGTTVMDPSQWQKQFGIEFDHCDQYEIVYRATSLAQDRVKKHVDWVHSSFSNIKMEDKFTPETLEKQVRSYLALKDMAEEKHFDFMGVKCQQDMSDHFVLQCLGVALLNNDMDGEGKKKPIPTSCECDSDGALTMRILNLCADNKPSCLLDIKFFDALSKEFVLANCGSVAPYFADPSDFREAAKKVTLMSHIFGEAGGASLQMIAQPGDVTLARLFRSDGKYILGCVEGHTKMYPLEKLKETTFCYPHAFVEAEADYEKFYQRINSNHLHMVYGKHKNVLEKFCKLSGIEFLDFSK